MQPGGKSVLLVEDDDDVRGAVAAVLEGEGHRVVEATHGAEALQCLRGSTLVCMILLDLWMPVMNGFEFRAEQLKDPALAAVPVVVITADRAAARKATDLGVLACMTKPIEFEQLLGFLEQYC